MEEATWRRHHGGGKGSKVEGGILLEPPRPDLAGGDVDPAAGSVEEPQRCVSKTAPPGNTRKRSIRDAFKYIKGDGAPAAAPLFRDPPGDPFLEGFLTSHQRRPQSRKGRPGEPRWRQKVPKRDQTAPKTD